MIKQLSRTADAVRLKARSRRRRWGLLGPANLAAQLYNENYGQVTIIAIILVSLSPHISFTSCLFYSVLPPGWGFYLANADKMIHCNLYSGFPGNVECSGTLRHLYVQFSEIILLPQCLIRAIMTRCFIYSFDWLRLWANVLTYFVRFQVYRPIAINFKRAKIWDITRDLVHWIFHSIEQKKTYKQKSNSKK